MVTREADFEGTKNKRDSNNTSVMKVSNFRGSHTGISPLIEQDF